MQQVKPSNPHEEQEILDGIDKVYYNTEGIDTSHYELRVRCNCSWLICYIFYKVQIHCQENLINTDFVVMICFALSDLFMFPLQKLPEVLDLGDIDLDRKRLRKQLQVVRIMNCIWQLSITSF